MQIVIAWAEPTRRMVKPGKPDLGVPAVYEDAVEPRSCMWLNNGSADDAVKAVRYAESQGNGSRVFCYSDDPDPLARARQDVLKHTA